MNEGTTNLKFSYKIDHEPSLLFPGQRSVPNDRFRLAFESLPSDPISVAITATTGTFRQPIWSYVFEYGDDSRNVQAVSTYRHSDRASDPRSKKFGGAFRPAKRPILATGLGSQQSGGGGVVSTSKESTRFRGQTELLDKPATRNTSKVPLLERGFEEGPQRLAHTKRICECQ